MASPGLWFGVLKFGRAGAGLGASTRACWVGGGAGGGGCVVLLIDPDVRERVERAIDEAGAEVLPVKIDRQGVQVVSR